MKKDGQRSVPKKQGAKPKRAKKSLGRPRLAGKPTYLRLDDETLRRVEARQKALQAQNKVSNVGQGDVLRALVRDGLDLAERKHVVIAASTEAAASLDQLILFMEELTVESLDRMVLVDRAKACVERLVAAGARRSVARRSQWTEPAGVKPRRNARVDRRRSG